MPRSHGVANWAAPARRPKKTLWERRPARSAAAPRNDATQPPEPVEPVEPVGRAAAGEGVLVATEGVASSAEAAALLRETRISRAAFWQLWWLNRARKLWGNYTVNLEAEKLEAPDIWEEVATSLRTRVSSYRRRLKQPRLILHFEAKTDRMIRDEVAVRRRRRNQLDIPFSVDARTMSYFNQRVPTRVWRDQQHGMRILHRDVAMNLLKEMKAIEPGPTFIRRLKPKKR